MSEPENFLERWSRRKLQAEEQPAAGKPAPDPEAADPEAPDVVGAIADAAKAEFDLASLPPLESIEAATDIRAFLAPGVPAELTRAALRRAWQADPTIRDFIGIAENQWDFTKPDGVPGFGSLPFGSEVSRMVGNLLEAQPHMPPPQDAEQVAQATDVSGELPAPASADAIQAASAAEPSEGDHAAPEAPDGRDQVLVRSSEHPAAPQDNGEAGEQSRPVAHRKHGGAIPR